MSMDSAAGDPGLLLLKRLEAKALAGEEDSKFDLKREVDLEGQAGRAGIARDIAAMANTPGGPGNLLLGVADLKDRSGEGPESSYVGLPTGWPTPQRVEQAVVQSLHRYVSPPPRFRYREVAEPSTGRRLGLITVFRSRRRPHCIAADGHNVRKNEIWIRHGSHTQLAEPEEIREMHADSIASGEEAVVLNFSHPLTDSALGEMDRVARCVTAYVVEIPVQLDEEAGLAAQARRLADFADLTPHEWQTLPIIVVPTGHPAMAAALVAELHGRMGHFPTIVRLKPDRSGPATIYPFAELINLEEVRANARERR